MFKSSKSIVNHRALAFILIAVAFCNAAIDTVYLEIAVSGVRTIPLGLVHFEGNAVSALDEAPQATLERDFFLSGRFGPVVLAKYDRMTFYKNRVAYFISGKLSKTPEGQIEMECKLIAVQSLTLVVGQTYKVPAKQIRQALHDFADQVTYQLTGAKGVASSRLAWVSKIKGYKQIVVGDYDGFNSTQVTTHASINMMPTWSRDLNKIYFTSFRSGTSQLYERNLTTGSVRMLFPNVGQAYSPAASPVSDELLFTVSENGKSNLWMGNILTGKAQKLSYQRASETSPAWSPNGHEILFSADRGGSPQIYAMDANGADVRRVTFMGRYNESASWSPEGDRIVYTSMDPSGFNIYTCGLDGSNVTQLTNNAGNNEHPVWSPDGMLIAFASDRSGSHQIYLMRKDGSAVTRITNGGNNTWPSWAPTVSSLFQEQPQEGEKP